jgi:hypothetical protein
VTTAAPANLDSTAVDSFLDVPLLAHARDSAGPVQSLSVSGTLHRSGGLTVEFQLAAELRNVRLMPAVCQPQRRDELWRHTCFELFVRCDNEPRYCEFNFAASGDWAAYEFGDYRAAPHDAPQPPIEVTVHTTAQGQVRLRARIDLPAAFARDRAALDAASWQLNCAAVIEAADGALSHWAIHHPRTQPDFHDPEGFRIALKGATALARSEVAPR